MGAELELIFVVFVPVKGGGETGLAAALQGLASPEKGLPWLDVTPEIHRQPLTRQGLETCTWPGR